MRQGEDLGGVGEWHRTFAWRIKGVEQENEERNQTKMCATRLGYPETEASSQQRPAHVRESEDKQWPSTECVDSPNGGPGKHKIH